MLNAAEQFFYEHAGYSHGLNETTEQGRIRCAKQLAAAEAYAKREGFTFEWGEDDIDSSFYDDNESVYALFYCVMRDAAGLLVKSLGGCDFGDVTEVWHGRFPYQRVVEAELASEVMPELEDVAIISTTE